MFDAECESVVKLNSSDGFLVPKVTEEMLQRVNERRKDAVILKIQEATTIGPGVICIERRLFSLEENNQSHMLQVRRLSADGLRAVVYNAKFATTTCVRTIACADLVYCFKDLEAMNSK